ncbi:MAG: sulfotransferase [Acidobacteriota bacterium]
MNQQTPDSATPILVIGSSRSGTKWLSNILCNHSEIAGVQAQRHNGILETNLFDTMQMALGDVSQVENYVALIELWAQTDFFKAANASKEIFYKCSPRPDSCLAVFGLLMNTLARENRKCFLLQKMSPRDAPEVLRFFQGCRIVTMRRKMIPVLESRLQKERNRGVRLSVARSAFHYALQAKILSGISRRNGVISVDYDQLCNDTEGVARTICRELGIEFESEMLSTGYRRNTSFRSRKRNRFSGRERLVARTVAGLTRSLPLPILRWIRERFRNKQPQFIPGTFAEIIDRYHIK